MLWIYSTLTLFGEVCGLTILFYPFHHCTDCCRRFWWKYVPVSRSSLFFLSGFFHWGLGEYILVFYCFGFCSLFLFWTFYVFFGVLTAFELSMNLFDSTFWLLFLTRLSSHLFVSSTSNILCVSMTSKKTLNTEYFVMLKWRSLHLWIHVPPSKVWPQLCPRYTPTNPFFCVHWVLMRPPNPVMIQEQFRIIQLTMYPSNYRCIARFTVTFTPTRYWLSIIMLDRIVKDYTAFLSAAVPVGEIDKLTFG